MNAEVLKRMQELGADTSRVDHDASLNDQLANIEFEQSNFEQSLIHCQTILAFDISEDQKSETLLLLGNIYQQRGLHHHASLCFSGVIPNF